MCFKKLSKTHGFRYFKSLKRVSENTKPVLPENAKTIVSENARDKLSN